MFSEFFPENFCPYTTSEEQRCATLNKAVFANDRTAKCRGTYEKLYKDYQKVIINALDNLKLSDYHSKIIKTRVPADVMRIFRDVFTGTAAKLTGAPLP